MAVDPKFKNVEPLVHKVIIIYQVHHEQSATLFLKYYVLFEYYLILITHMFLSSLNSKYPYLVDC